MYHITIQLAAGKIFVPTQPLLRKWAKKALGQKTEKDNVAAAEITIRIVTAEEMALLNVTYRNKKGPTNILSFPLSEPEETLSDAALIGDIAICADIVNREAKEQQKTRHAHWAHMIVHGILHLRGYDHQKKKAAQIMEAHEIHIMRALKFANPYIIGKK